MQMALFILLAYDTDLLAAGDTKRITSLSNDYYLYITNKFVELKISVNLLQQEVAITNKLKAD